MTDKTTPKTPMELRHLGREVQTALELAIVALAPSVVVERLAIAAGLLGAVVDLPLDSPAVAALVPGLETRANAAIKEWSDWREKHLREISA